MPNSDSIYRMFERLIYKITGKPKYYKYVVNNLNASAFSEMITRIGFKTKDIEYFSKKNRFYIILAKVLPSRLPNNMYLGIYKKTKL